MNIKNVGNGESIGLGLRARSKKSEEVEKQTVQKQQKQEVAVGTVRRLQDSISVAEMQAEREAKLNEIREQVKSGEYFKNRSVGDIAKILDAKLGEEVSIERLFENETDKE